MSHLTDGENETPSRYFQRHPDVNKAAEFNPKVMGLLGVFILILMAERETLRFTYSSVSSEKDSSLSHGHTGVCAEMSPVSTLLRC